MDIPMSNRIDAYQTERDALVQRIEAIQAEQQRIRTEAERALADLSQQYNAVMTRLLRVEGAIEALTDDQACPN